MDVMLFIFLQENTNLLKSLLLLFMDGIFYMLQNVFAFTVIAMVAPLSYSVANAMKRVVIIGASLFLLRNPVTTMNVAGMLVACFGVLCYNKVTLILRLWVILKTL
jgi:solute carrier family 35 protein E1